METSTADGLLAVANSAAQAITKGGPRRQYKWGKRMLDYQNKINRKNAEWTLAQNRILSQEQRDYDSPKMQMARFKEANLNPHLAYTQGNVGNMNSPVTTNSLPAANFGHIDTSYANPVQGFQEAQLMQSQMGLTNQKIEESEQKTSLARQQEEVLKANPYLRPAYVDAIVKNMEAIAFLKNQEKKWHDIRVSGDGMHGYPQGYIKMNAELKLLETKYKLSELDQKVKAQIIESKAFENDLKEVQAKWAKDGEISPQLIYDSIFKILSLLR